MGNKVYGVIYPGGSSGQFIKSMLVYILSDDDIDMDFNDGSSHWYYKRYLQSKPYLSILSDFSNKNPEKYNIIANINSTSPLIDSPASDSSLQKIYNSGLDYKLIYIHVDTDDLFVINTNHYYKQPAVIPVFTKLSNRLFSITDLSKLNSNQKKIIMSHPDMFAYTTKYVPTVNKLLSEYAENLYRIDFKDILNDPDKVKILLETITDKKMSTHAHRQYDRYVERQIEFRKEKGF